MSKRVAAIIVTHNSQKVLEHCVKALLSQRTALHRTVIVDCGSSNRDYLEKVSSHHRVEVVLKDNVGFSKANNIGVAYLQEDFDYLIFINPDLFLPEDFVTVMQSCFDRLGNRVVLGGKLKGYDIEGETPTGLLDSTGIFRKWYGRWYDRGQGEADSDQYERQEKVKALCGALLCMPIEVIRQLSYRVFNEDFFLYKEDIELGLRLNKSGINTIYEPTLEAYHCRGWNTSRSDVDFRLKLLAAESELKLYRYHPSVYMIFAVLKYLLVKVFKV